MRTAQLQVAAITKEAEADRTGALCPVPDETLPLMSGTFNVPLYGMNRWGDLFTARQALTQVILGKAIQGLHGKGAVAEVMALALSRRADIANSICPWSTGADQVVHLFGRQAIPMAWDFAESCPLGNQAGDYGVSLATIIRVIETLALASQGTYGQVELADAADHPLPSEAASVWFTDPPYYFAVPYADLSDFFFVWLKRALPLHPLLHDPFDKANRLTPKDKELCEMAHWDSARYAHKDQAFFEAGMGRAFAEGRRVLSESGIGCVVFAHKTTEGWEALLSAMIHGGWTITGSWPIATERPGRLRSQDSAALATSVHLICRPRTENTTGDWSAVLRELPRRVSEWMQRLQAEHVRGADLVFACIGPALEVFSRYANVETAEGREVPLAEYLEKVWEVVGRAALEQVLGGSTGVLEEDARLTALFLWTLQSSNGVAAESEDEADQDDEDDEDQAPKGKKKAGGYSLVFDVARRFAQPLGIHLPEWEGRIIETEKGVVRLLPVNERAKQLFGEDGAGAAAAAFERNPVTAPQMVLFPEDATTVPRVRGRGGRKVTADSSARVAAAARREPTTLDRVHAAMLLQRSGRSNALRALLAAEQDRGTDFLRLANGLSALYPRVSEEKRLLDAMLLAVPR